MAAGGDTTATPTSAWDVAAAAASCEDGRGEEDVHNGDPGERAGHASERASGRLRRGVAGDGLERPPPPPST